MGRGLQASGRVAGLRGRSAQLERREPGRQGWVTAARPPLTAHGAAPRSGACALPPPQPPLSSRQAGRQRAPPRPSIRPAPEVERPPPRPRPPTRNVNTDACAARGTRGAEAGATPRGAQAAGDPGQGEPPAGRPVVRESPRAVGTQQGASPPSGAHTPAREPDREQGPEK